MAIYLGLGSNQGDRRRNLRLALGRLADEGIRIGRVSPVVESPALLPPDAPADWNRPYLNLVAECRTRLDPADLLDRLKRIERSLGRADIRRWSPRTIDIDILLYHELITATASLTIPHAAIDERAFVLTPLAALVPGLKIPGHDRTARELCVALGRRIPLWMGIVNLTPDSFSDGGENETWAAVEAQIDRMAGGGVQIIDFGAESTRPGAVPLSAEEEWARLQPMLSRTIAKLGNDPLRPSISVDTYHAEVAAKALDAGIDIVNDVGGLTDTGMLRLAAASDAEFVAMHNLGLPADPGAVLDGTRGAADQVGIWLDRQIEAWLRAGVSLDRIIFDPGIGFGKNPLQSLELLRDIDRFARGQLRLLVGHSRKSFMGGFAGGSMAERDLVTIGSSMALCARGVDILRVHNTADHVAAYRGWSHTQRDG